MDEPEPMTPRGRLIAGLFWGGWLGVVVFIVGPIPVFALIGLMLPGTWVAYRSEIEAFYSGSFGMVPVGAAVGAAVAYITRPNR